MDVNIQITSDTCMDYVVYFNLIEGNNLNIQFENPIKYYVDNNEKYMHNSLGWKSWLNLFSFSNINKIGNSGNMLNEDVLEFNFFKLEDFLNGGLPKTFVDFQTMFFANFRLEYYPSILLSEHLLKLYQKGIDQYCLGVAINMIYHVENDKLIPDHKDFLDSCNQLLLFYESYKLIYSTEKLFIFPHLDPYSLKMKEELEKNNFLQEEFCNEFDWSELGEDEIRRMDDETEGDWRWNVD